MEELKEKIKQLIAPNGKNAITAQVLQNVLLEIVDEVEILDGEKTLIAESLTAVELSDREQDKSIDAIIENITKLEQADTAFSKQLQEQEDSITANATAIEDIGEQIGDIDTILTEIIGGE